MNKQMNKIIYSILLFEITKPSSNNTIINDYYFHTLLSQTLH